MTRLVRNALPAVARDCKSASSLVGPWANAGRLAPKRTNATAAMARRFGPQTALCRTDVLNVGFKRPDKMQETGQLCTFLRIELKWIQVNDLQKLTDFWSDTENVRVVPRQYTAPGTMHPDPQNF